MIELDTGHLDVLARLEISTQAKSFIVDAVQQGYGVLVPERMVEWDGGETIAWWQVDLETGEMIGVGEDGTHQSIVRLIGEAKFFISIAKVLVAVFEIMLITARYLVWKESSALTWFYFWRVGMSGLSCTGAGLAQCEGTTPSDVYREALRKTKNYMNNEAWDQFEDLFFMPAWWVW